MKLIGISATVFMEYEGEELLLSQDTTVFDSRAQDTRSGKRTGGYLIEFDISNQKVLDILTEIVISKWNEKHVFRISYNGKEVLGRSSALSLDGNRVTTEIQMNELIENQN